LAPFEYIPHRSYLWTLSLSVSSNCALYLSFIHVFMSVRMFSDLHCHTFYFIPRSPFLCICLILLAVAVSRLAFFQDVLWYISSFSALDAKTSASNMMAFYLELQAGRVFSILRLSLRYLYLCPSLPFIIFDFRVKLITISCLIGASNS
jgi:hypothetical protein